ncbi:MAG TPA: hypothetical protein VFF07_00630 [Actinomycetota bacterium]|nr:hypothetical protein [Actinomycetota bacterium]
MFWMRGGWAEKWTELTNEHAEPDYVLWAWCRTYLRRDLLPDGRVVVRFEFHQRGRRVKHWLLIERGDGEVCRIDPGFGDGEVCRIDPGFGDDVVVVVTDALMFARWHLGLVGWAAALRSGGIQVSGPRYLCRALPTWNGGPETATKRRAKVGTSGSP